MAKLYNEIAGQKLSRLEALSDGIFGVAMTLLVLDLHVPVSTLLHPINSEHDLWKSMIPLWPTALSYVMSFVTLGIFWIGQQTQFNMLARSDRNLSWIHIAFLLTIALMPGSTAFLAAFMTFRLALLGYWANILLMGALLYAGWTYAKNAGLLRDTVTPEVDATVRRRIVIAQILYAIGAAAGMYDTYWGVALIVIVQLNYALAPRLFGLYRL